MAGQACGMAGMYGICSEERGGAHGVADRESVCVVVCASALEGGGITPEYMPCADVWGKVAAYAWHTPQKFDRKLQEASWKFKSFLSVCTLSHFSFPMPPCLSASP